MSSANAIGVFDSGLGGLSAVKEFLLRHIVHVVLFHHVEDLAETAQRIVVVLGADGLHHAAASQKRHKSKSGCGHGLDLSHRMPPKAGWNV